MILPSVIIFFWAGFAYTGEMVLLDFLETEQKVLANDLPPELWNQIILDAIAEDPMTFKNIFQVNHQFCNISRNHLENYRNTIEKPEFQVCKKLLKLPLDIYHGRIPGLFTIEETIRKSLNDFRNKFEKQEKTSLKETLQFIKDIQPIEESVKISLYRKKLELQLNRANKYYTIEQEKAYLDKIEKQAKELELPSYFLQEIDKLRNKFQENIENFSKDSVENSQKMQEIWAEYAHEIANLNSSENIKSFRQKIKECYKTLGLGNPFYSIHSYDNGFKLLQDFVKRKRDQIIEKIVDTLDILSKTNEDLLGKIQEFTALNKLLSETKTLELKERLELYKKNKEKIECMKNPYHTLDYEKIAILKDFKELLYQTRLVLKNF